MKLEQFQDSWWIRKISIHPQEPGNALEEKRPTDKYVQ